MPPATGTRPHALVIGGSIGGLFAARLLQRAGWRTTIYERSAGNLLGRGAGVGISQELMNILAEAGAPIDPTIGLAVDSFVWLGRDGAPVFEQPRPMGASAWVRIYQALRTGFPEEDYVNGTALARVEQDGGGVTAVFEDGSRASGDLLVAADGNMSTVRQQFLPAVVPAYAGYVAWRGVVDRSALPAEAQHAIDRHIVFSFAPGPAGDDISGGGGDMMLTMPVPGLTAEATEGRYYFIWYRPVGGEAAMADLFTDAEGRHHGLSIPPPLIRADILDRLRADAQTFCSPAAAAAVQRAPQPLIQAISDLASPKLDHGRVALLGDAAFVARPHVAAGITKAAMNAKSLVAALSETGDVPTALARYDADQRDLGQGMIDHARFIGAYIEPGAADRAPDEKTIMREYGAPHLIRDPDPAAFEPK